MTDRADFERRLERTVSDWLDTSAPIIDATRVTMVVLEHGRTRRRLRSSTRLVLGVAVILALTLTAALAVALPSATPRPPAMPATPSPHTYVDDFAPAGSMRDARSRHTATLLHDGRVLVVGGEGSTTSTASAETWDPGTESFSLSRPLEHARSAHTATRLADGRVLIVGGIGPDGSTDCVTVAEVWDPATGSVASAGQLAYPRAWHTATLLRDGRVLVVGGAHCVPCSVDTTCDDGHVPHIADTELWAPTTATFQPAAMLAQPRAFHTATILSDGRVLIVGGLGCGQCSELVASSEIWDLATAAFAPSGSLSQVRSDHTATLLADGGVLVVGGEGDQNSGTDSLGVGFSLASAEVWDAATGTFAPAGTMAQVRSAHTASVLSDGRVLVTGGRYGLRSRELDSAELWDPATGAFSDGPSLAQPSVRHTATLLVDGRVLVVGGSDSTLAELYH